MNILVPLTLLSISAVFAGLYLTRRRHEQDARYSVHYAPNPEPIIVQEDCRAIREAEAIIEEAMQR